MRDPMRPHDEPARALYDELFKAMQTRDLSKDCEIWDKNESQALLKAANKAAAEHGLGVVTLKDVEEAQSQALGHSDYTLSWARAVVDRMHRNNAKNK